MRVLFATSEIYPFVKTGGLGDVAAALPEALAQENIDIRLFLPGFPEILKNVSNVKVIRKLSPFFGLEDSRLLFGTLPNGIGTYILDCPTYYSRPGPYGDPEHKDWPDNHLRFAAFCKAASDLHLYDDEWQPHVIHGNDWQCGLIPAYLNLRGRDRPKSIITIHNIAYQGLFPASVLSEINLPPDIFTVRGIEFYGKVGFLKAGLQYADKITTVSPTYALEIMQQEFGSGLEGLLREREKDVIGILNGIDYKIWNPEIDTNIFAKYSSDTLKLKTKNRTALLEKLGLVVQNNMPVFGVISRLVTQKGLDLLVKAAPEVLKMGAGIVVLGSGDQTLEKQFKDLASLWPAQMYVSTDYDEVLAHKIMGGADSIVVPSRFEPCGLVQMYGLRYGTIPVVRKTGGLADSVLEDSIHSTGFVFEHATVQELSEALVRVCALFRAPAHWLRRQQNAMAQNFGWKASATKYIDLYRELSGQ